MTPSEFAARRFPAQVPLRDDAYLTGVADLLNGAPFSVVFNVYDPKHGTSVMFGNDAAGPL